MLFDQVSVGLSNDWIDAERDRAVGRTDKPVAQGQIGVATVRAAAWIAAAVVTASHPSAGFRGHGGARGRAGLGMVVQRRAEELADLGASRTWSASGSCPRSRASRGRLPALPAWWVFAAGALLGIAAHFANVLPDLDDDRRTGIRGLPHRLGLRPSIVITWVALLLGAVAVTVGVGSGPTGIPVFAVVGLARLDGDLGRRHGAGHAEGRRALVVPPGDRRGACRRRDAGAGGYSDVGLT